MAFVLCYQPPNHSPFTLIGLGKYYIKKFICQTGEKGSILLAHPTSNPNPAANHVGESGPVPQLFCRLDPFWHKTKKFQNTFTALQK